MKMKDIMSIGKKGIVLSVAGSDCSGGAGVQADIKTVSALGGYAAAAITAVTVQNTLGVQRVYPVPAEVVGQQMEAVLEDLKPDVVKIGMTGSAEVVREISRVLLNGFAGKIVLDPVMASTSGHKLMDKETVEAICTELLPIVSLVTPNLHEIAPLLPGASGCVPASIEEMKRAAQEIYQTYGCACLVKGGHLEGEKMCDVLHDGHETHCFSTERIDSKNLHGTGCTLSSAIATFLAHGDSLHEAVKQAKNYVTWAIGAAQHLEIGKGNGPLWHFIIC